VKKKDWFIISALILSIIALDQITKQWALTELRVFGKWLTPFMGCFLHKNHGAMLGSFSDLPPLLRIVSLATGGVFLIFIFSIIMSVLQHRLLVLRTGMAILLGGILGNVTDRITHGPVTDFIVFKGFGMFSPAFNIADATQWVGYVLVCYSIFKDGHLIWPDDNKRSKFWVDRKYQLKYCFTFVGYSAVFSLILGVYSFTFLKVMVSESIKNSEFMSHQSLLPFVIVFSLVSLTFLLVIFMLGLRLSHRSVGPVFAFRGFINDLREGRTRNLKLRSHDEFKYLEEEARLLKRDYRHYRRLKSFIETLKKDNVIPLKPEYKKASSDE
jgi:signal peptidase II